MLFLLPTIKGVSNGPSVVTNYIFITTHSMVYVTIFPICMISVLKYMEEVVYFNIFTYCILKLFMLER